MNPAGSCYLGINQILKSFMLIHGNGTFWHGQARSERASVSETPFGEKNSKAIRQTKQAHWRSGHEKRVVAGGQWHLDRGARLDIPSPKLIDLERLNSKTSEPALGAGFCQRQSLNPGVRGVEGNQMPPRVYSREPLTGALAVDMASGATLRRCSARECTPGTLNRPQSELRST